MQENDENNKSEELRKLEEQLVSEKNKNNTSSINKQEEEIKTFLAKQYEGVENYKTDMAGNRILSGKRVDEEDEEGKQPPILYKEDATTSKPFGPTENGDWKLIALQSLPSYIFYPDNMEVWIRSVTTREIQQWSTIVNDNFYSISTELSKLITSCVRVRIDKTWLSPDVIRITDKLKLMLEIKDHSIRKTGKLNINYTHEIENCGHKGNVELDVNHIMNYDIQDTMIKIDDEEISIMEFYNSDPNVLAFEFQTEWREEPYRFAPPTIGLETSIFSWVKKKIEGAKNPEYAIDNSFIMTVPLLLYDRNKITDKGIDIWHKRYQEMSEKEFSFIHSIASSITVGPKHLVHKCERCGTEVYTDILFPDGYKSIFISEEQSLSGIKRPNKSFRIDR